MYSSVFLQSLFMLLEVYLVWLEKKQSNKNIVKVQDTLFKL